MVFRTGIDTIIASYATTLRGVWDIPAAALDALECRRAKVRERWAIIGHGWSAHVEGGHMRPRRAVIRLDSGSDGIYRPPMRPSEIIARLMEACTVMGAGEWRDGVVRRVDYTLDELRASSPAPEAIPRFYRAEEYPNGGALFLSGKKPAEGEKRKKPAERAMIVYDKTLQLRGKTREKGDDVSCGMDALRMWRVEYRFSTRSACAKIGLSTVEDALTALLAWDALAPHVSCALLPEAFSIAWKRVRVECSSLPEVRRLCARLRSSLEAIPEGRPRKSIIAAVKGGEERDRGGQGAEGCEWVGENEPSFGKGGREKKGGGEIIIEEGRRAQKARLPRVRGPPRGSGERKRAPKKARPEKAC